MNLKRVLFGNLIDFEKQSSTYFNLDGQTVVALVFLLSEILRRLNNFLAYFGVLVLFIVAFFEKKNDLVKFYCYEYGLFIIAYEILIAFIGILMIILPIFWIFFTILIFVLMIINLAISLYMLYRATFQNKGWKIPWLGDFVLNKIKKVNY